MRRFKEPAAAPVRIPVLDITRQAWSVKVVVMAVRVLIYEMQSHSNKAR